jgi:hypothetical protein
MLSSGTCLLIGMWKVRDNPGTQNLCGRDFDASTFSRDTNHQRNNLEEILRGSARKRHKSGSWEGKRESAAFLGDDRRGEFSIGSFRMTMMG